MSYQPKNPPESDEDLQDWAWGEFQQIGIELDSPYVELHVAPTRPRTGLVVLADGTDWDPGSGAGFYGYYGSAWHKLG